MSEEQKKQTQNNNNNNNSNNHNKYTENLNYDSNATYLFPKYQVIYIDYIQGMQKTIIIDSLPALNHWIENNLIFSSPINMCQITKIYTIQE